MFAFDFKVLVCVVNWRFIACLLLVCNCFDAGCLFINAGWIWCWLLYWLVVGLDCFAVYCDVCWLVFPDTWCGVCVIMWTCFLLSVFGLIVYDGLMLVIWFCC